MREPFFKVGVVGCGNVFERHRKAMTDLPKWYKLKAVCDIKRSNIESYLPISSEVEIFSDFGRMLTEMKNKLNLIVITTPSYLHTRQAKRALDLGYSVLIEKPVTLSVRDALSISQRASRNQRKAFVVLQVRQNPLVKVLKEAMKRKILGKIRMVNFILRWQRQKNFFKSWRGSEVLAGGLLYEIGVHYLDILHDVFGMPDVINASKYKLKYLKAEYEDTVLTTLIFPKGILGTAEFTIAAEPGNLECSLTMIGSKGRIELGGKLFEKIEHMDFFEKDARGEGFKRWARNFMSKEEIAQKSGKASPYHTKLYEKIALGEGLEITDALASLRLVEEIYQKCRIRQ